MTLLQPCTVKVKSRSNGLTCIEACDHCHGTECLNVTAAVACDSDGECGNSVTGDPLMYFGNDFDYTEEVEVDYEEVS